ncbi:hypothetical protein GOY17_15300 [Lysobacter soli]|uniref:hypothetical protein n=1 Tax=Lysobacter soli TaxID=453783 RepID=UPI0012EE5A3E|nr:hypothetical protein [Lysobacter soli]QGW66158.1 hypothetical protein GOY17_15300 [Lysobacter soli]
MLDALWSWAGSHLLFGLACMAVGVIVVAPLLLSHRFRRWFARSDIDLEYVGLGVLILVVLCVGVSNYLRGPA